MERVKMGRASLRQSAAREPQAWFVPTQAALSRQDFTAELPLNNERFAPLLT
jgi:hypothetical protein